MSMIGCFAAVSPSTLAELRADPDSIDEYLHPDDGDAEPPNYLEVDKAWHGLQWLFTGVADGGDEPLSLAIAGGEEFGPEVGYGPARFLTPQEVKRVSAALDALSVMALKVRYEPKTMAAADIYPNTWESEGAEGLDYVLQHHSRLVAFYRAAAQRGDAVLQWLA